MSIELGDVYRFSYNADAREKIFMPSHCFDGMLVANKDINDSIVLIDTYWVHSLNDFFDGGAHFSTGMRFSESEALAKGTLTYLCNLGGVDLYGRKEDTIYYRESKIFNLSHQHGCYQLYGILKGAKRDKDTMLTVVKKQILDEESDLMSAVRRMRLLEVKAHRIESGDLDVWL